MKTQQTLFWIGINAASLLFLSWLFAKQEEVPSSLISFWYFSASLVCALGGLILSLVFYGGLINSIDKSDE